MLELFSILRSVHMTGHGQPLMETGVFCVGLVQGHVTNGTKTSLKKGGGGHQTLKIIWKTGRCILDVLEKVKELLRLDGSQRFCGLGGAVQVELSITASVFFLVKLRRHLSTCSGVSVELYGPKFPSMCNDYSSVKLEGGTLNVSACVSVPTHFQFQISFF